MTTAHPGHDAEAGHIDVEELADLGEGLLDTVREQQVRAHLAGCAACRDTVAALETVHQQLAATPPPPMPAHVFARLQASLESEQRRREALELRRTTGRLSGPGLPSTLDPYSNAPSYDDRKYQPGRRTASSTHPSHPSGQEGSHGSADSDQEGDRGSHGRSQGRDLGLQGRDRGLQERDRGRSSMLRSRHTKPKLADHFNQRLEGDRRGRARVRARFAAGALCSTVLAAVIGFGGYVASASAGTAEPPTDRPVLIQDGNLKQAAIATLDQGDLDSYHFTQAYYFSRAWRCAIAVTDGPISGIRGAVHDSRSGYLVFLRSDSHTRAVFISGCDTGNPAAGPSVTLGRS